jgi:hypothetical protein
MGMKKEKRFKPKGYVNIFHKIIAENFPNVEKELSIQIQEASRTPNRLDQIENFHAISSLKQPAQRTEKD